MKVENPFLKVSDENQTITDLTRSSTTEQDNMKSDQLENQQEILYPTFETPKEEKQIYVENIDDLLREETLKYQESSIKQECDFNINNFELKSVSIKNTLVINERIENESNQMQDFKEFKEFKEFNEENEVSEVSEKPEDNNSSKADYQS